LTSNDDRYGDISNHWTLMIDELGFAA